MNLVAGKVALVTEAVGGIGEAMALRLAQGGAAVVLRDIDEAGGAATVARLAAEGHAALYPRHNFSDEARCSNVFPTTTGVYLHTCAGLTVKDDIPGSRGPVVEALLRSGRAWLAEGNRDAAGSRPEGSVSIQNNTIEEE